MTRYRWLNVRKALETLDYLPKIPPPLIVSHEATIFDCIAKGKVRIRIDGEIVPTNEASIYMKWTERMWAVQRSIFSEPQNIKTIPNYFEISLDDIYSIFDNPPTDLRQRGRPKTENGNQVDKHLANEMHRRISTNAAKSAANAAQQLVDEGKVSGGGTPESKAKRLQRAFRSAYTS